MSLNKKIIDIRVELQNTTLKKSGKNKFAGFEYYELSDFLPTLNMLMQKHEVNDLFSIENGVAKLSLMSEDECNTYEIPFVMFDTPTNKNGSLSMQPIQYLGALNTYYKRYLYLNAFGITDGEVIDSMDNATIAPPPSKATPEDKKRVWGEFVEHCGRMDVQAMDFLSSVMDTSDQNAVYKEVRLWLKNVNQLNAQLIAFKNQ